VNSPVPRRLALIGCALVATATLASCSTFSDNDAVARVGDVELTQDELQEMIESPIGRDFLQVAPDQDGRIDAAAVRTLIGTWAAFTVIDQGGFISDDRRKEATDQISEAYGADWQSSPEEIRMVAVLNGVLRVMLQAGELEAAKLRSAVDTADIHIDSFYGSWDGVAVAVVPMLGGDVASSDG